MGKRKWITPFNKQCFVTVGVCLNMTQVSMVMGFTANLLPQLRKSDSIIPIDDSSGSWIAAIPGFGIMLGNITVPIIMGKYGRKIGNIISTSVALIGWLWIVLSSSIISIILARFFQGISIGFALNLAPILIGEYTSPKNRGAFLSVTSLVKSAAAGLIHFISFYVNWQRTALYCAFISFVNLLIVLYSPESPSWLVDKGKHEDGRKIFVWLRGDTDTEELEKMITANVAVNGENIENSSSDSIVHSLQKHIHNFFITLTRPEFYKPIMIMVHMHIICQAGGIDIFSVYVVDVVKNAVSTDGHVIFVVVTTLGVNRVLSNVLTTFFIKKIKRRVLSIYMFTISISIMFVIGVYSYIKIHKIFVNSTIGIILLHVHMFSVGAGTLPIPYVIAGEIFPIRYRSVAGGISAFAASLSLFFVIKTFTYLIASVNYYGLYWIYSSIVGYCLIIVWRYLPETKDRTLVDIEQEFTNIKTDEGTERE